MGQLKTHKMEEQVNTVTELIKMLTTGTKPIKQLEVSWEECCTDRVVPVIKVEFWEVKEPIG